MQAEAAASGDNNPCDGNSLVATYYGKKINLLDFVNDYATNPKLEKDECSNYKGLENVDGPYYNSVYNDYQYVVPYSNYHILDVEKNNPIVSFVKEEYLHKEGDWGLIGDEYGYYINCEHVNAEGLRVGRIDDANNLYDNFNKFIQTDIQIYKSTVTIVRYDISSCDLKGNIEFRFTPLILAEMEIFAVNNSTSYKDIIIHDVCKGKHCFILHKNGWNIVSHFVDITHTEFKEQDRERISKLESKGYKHVFLPALRYDYCLYKNSFLSYEEKDEEIYRQSAENIITSCKKYGVNYKTNQIHKINEIDFSKDDRFFTINNSSNFYDFDSPYVNERYEKAPNDYFNRDGINVPVSSFYDNQVEIKYNDKKCIQRIQTNVAYYTGVYQKMPSTGWKGLAKIGESCFNLAKDAVMEYFEISIPWYSVATDAVELAKNINEYFSNNNPVYETEKFQNSLIPLPVNSHCGYVYIDEFLVDDKLFTYYIEPEGCQEMMKDHNYTGMFLTNVSSEKIFSIEADSNKLPVNVTFEYSCQFGQIQKDGHIKEISISYVGGKTAWFKTFHLGKPVNKLDVNNVMERKFPPINKSNPEATFFFDLEDEHFREAELTFNVEKSGWYSISCIGEHFYTIDDFEAIIYDKNNTEIYKFTHMGDHKEIYLEAGSNCYVKLKTGSPISLQGQIYIVFSSPKSFIHGQEYEIELCGDTYIYSKQFTINRPMKIDYTILPHSENCSKEGGSNYTVCIYKNDSLFRTISGNKYCVEGSIILKDSAATYTIVVKDNRGKYGVPCSNYTANIKILLETNPYQQPKDKPIIYSGDGNGNFEPICK